MTAPGPPLSPAYLGRAGIARDAWRPGSERGWYCMPCRLRLQNGLDGARAHYRQHHSASAGTANAADGRIMTYTPIVLRIWRCLTQPCRPEPPPTDDAERFPTTIDYIVHTDRNGNRTEYMRYRVEFDNEHRICCTIPLADLHLTQEEVDRGA